MASLNKMTAIGNLGADPELKYTPDGKAVCNLRVPANDPVYNKERDEWVDNTLWINASVWEQQAERIAEKARKGSLVYIEGPIRLRNYTRQDGTTGVSVDMRRVNKLVLLERSNREQGSEDFVFDERPSSAPRQQPELDVDDIPF